MQNRKQRDLYSLQVTLHVVDVLDIYWGLVTKE